MNDSMIDTIKALILSLAIFGVTLILWTIFLEPIEQAQLDQVGRNCLLPECTYTIDPSWLNVIILVSPAILSYVIFVTRFESKRTNKWKNLG